MAKTVRHAYVVEARAGNADRLAFVGEVRATQRAELAFVVSGREAVRVGQQQSIDAEAAAAAMAARAQARHRAGLEPPTLAIEHALQQLEAQRGVTARRAEAMQAWAQVQLAWAAWQPEPGR